MVWWRSRPFGYKLGFFGLVVSAGVYLIAFSLPYWAVLYLREYGLVDQTVGLWQACALRAATCVSNVHRSNPPWLNAARATCTLAVVLLVVALFCGCYRNFSRLGQERCQGPGRHVEGLAVMACLLGLSGAIIFAYQFMADYIHVRQVGWDRELDLGRLHWAYSLLCSSLALVGLSACVMLVFNRRRYHAASPTRPASSSQHRRRGRLPALHPFSGGDEDEEEDRVHVPYLGEIWRTQLVPGAGPLQPPSYEMATGTSSSTGTGTGMGTGTTTDAYVGYATPPGDVSDAPPLYEDVGKDCVLSPPVPLPSLSTPSSQELGMTNQGGDSDDKAAGDEGVDGSPQSAGPPPPSSLAPPPSPPPSPPPPPV